MTIKKNISGAEALIHCLIEEGVDLIYGYPGGAIMPFYDELYKFQDKLQHVLTRHEQGATHAAQGYARVSGKVGVCVATSGPGATNLITGIADAMIDSTPLICITGQVPSHLLGSDAFQETDIIGISTPVTWDIITFIEKKNFKKREFKQNRIQERKRVSRKIELQEKLSPKSKQIGNPVSDIVDSFYIAKAGRPGPVLIDITKDAQFDNFDFKYSKCKGIRSYKPIPQINLKSVEDAAFIINKSKKPLIVWGQGGILGNAELEFKSFIEKTNIPAAWTILGVSAIPTSHPQNVGMVGMHGNYGPNMLTNECDVLIAIGMRFDDRVTGDLKTYAKKAQIIHLEIDPAEVNKNVKANVPILGDVKQSLPLLQKLVDFKNYTNWYETFKEHDKIEFENVIKNDLYPKKEGLTMGEVIKEINTATKGNAIIVTDVGQHQMVACRYADFNLSKSNITSGGLGTMGFALPAALGAKMADPKRVVVAVIGDGGIQMTIQELGTIFQTQAAVKVVVLNNEFLGMVRQWQQLFFDKRYASTELINPDFVKIAEGYYINSKRVSKRKELRKSIEEMIKSEKPFFLEVCVEKEDNVFPMIPSGASVSDIRLS